ncbi:hypothetical protein R3P38DRAFT_2759051 [Favolaschia claudopus]|uniref:Uncharacterized protein n=1 Tax=Favolaschia claudopus TaxID=2862362 RepID=A0AAW0E6Q2_9AGAR
MTEIMERGARKHWHGTEKRHSEARRSPKTAMETSRGSSAGTIDAVRRKEEAQMRNYGSTVKAGRTYLRFHVAVWGAAHDEGVGVYTPQMKLAENQNDADKTDRRETGYVCRTARVQEKVGIGPQLADVSFGFVKVDTREHNEVYVGAAGLLTNKLAPKIKSEESTPSEVRRTLEVENATPSRRIRKGSLCLPFKGTDSTRF